MYLMMNFRVGSRILFGIMQKSTEFPVEFSFNL